MTTRVSDQPDASDLRPIALEPSSSADGHAALSVNPGRGGKEAQAKTGVPFPIVGIGASAGVLDAVTQLLQALPVDTGSGFVLPPDTMADEIARVVRHPYVTPEPKPEALGVEPSSHARIADIVRRALGVDFTHYKSNTLLRRITRRMVLGCSSMKALH